MKSSNTTKTIKTANRYLVLDMIRNASKATIEDVIHTTRLSRPTVLSIIDDLLQQNIICQAGYAESSVGRQPVLYALSSSAHYAIGIDFEFPPVHLVITNLSGEIIYSRNANCSFSMEKDEIISLVVKEIQAAVDIVGLKREQILGIGLGIPGTVNIKRNMSDTISRIPEWNNTPISDILSSKFNIPVYVRNDAHLMALAAKASMPREENSMLYIAYRTGIGMAIVLDGELADWGYGNSGYIGHTTMDLNGDLCSCGRRGCLETFASKPTIVNKYAQITNLSKAKTFDEILALASEGNPIATDLLSTSGVYFGVAIANAVKLLDVSTVVIADLKCGADHIFVRTIERTVNKYCSSYALQPIKIIPQRLDESEYAHGAALFIIDTFFQKPSLKLSL